MRTLEENLRTPEENLTTPEENLRSPEDNLRTPEDNLRTSEENLTTPEANGRPLKEALATGCSETTFLIVMGHYFQATLLYSEAVSSG